MSESLENIKTVAIIAGGGNLPMEIINGLSQKDIKVFLILLKNEASDELYAFDHELISIFEFKRLVEILKKNNIKNIILAGSVKSRPQWLALRFDLITFFALYKIVTALKRGDDTLLKAFIKFLESYGFKVLAAQKLLPDLLAPKKSVLTKKNPTKADEKDISLALKAAYLLGKLDIGQGAIAVNGRVVAVEGAEGTDNMLKRIEEMRLEGRIPAHGGVLVKCSKPGQELRADLPTIGTTTIDNIVRAKLSGLAIEQGHSFIVNKEQTYKRANDHGIFIKTFDVKDYEEI